MISDFMVYCHKCGTNNNGEGRHFCSKCGTKLKTDEVSSDKIDNRVYRYHHRTEYFGLPAASLFVGLLFGTLLILLGISIIYRFSIWKYIWPIVVILFGILIITAAISNYGRNK
jgi:uncharacterized membrane protein YvbJ